MSKQEFSQKLGIEFFDGDEDICNRLKIQIQNVKDRVVEEARIRGNRRGKEMGPKEIKNMERVCAFV